MTPSSSSPPPELVDVFRRVRQDARSDQKPTEIAVPFTIEFHFDGGTFPPTLGAQILVLLGRINGRIVGASLVTNGSGTASIGVSLGNTTSWPTSTVIYDVIPTITGTAAAALELDTTNWTTINLQPGDILQATLSTLDTTSTFTTITLALECIRVKWPSGSLTVADNTSPLTDSSGNTVTIRN